MPLDWTSVYLPEARSRNLTEELSVLFVFGFFHYYFFFETEKVTRAGTLGTGLVTRA